MLPWLQRSQEPSRSAGLLCGRLTGPLGIALVAAGTLLILESQGVGLPLAKPRSQCSIPSAMPPNPSRGKEGIRKRRAARPKLRIEGRETQVLHGLGAGRSCLACRPGSDRLQRTPAPSLKFEPAEEEVAQQKIGQPDQKLSN